MKNTVPLMLNVPGQTVDVWTVWKNVGREYGDRQHGFFQPKGNT